jgi:hypothetical protein
MTTTESAVMLLKIGIQSSVLVFLATIGSSAGPALASMGPVIVGLEI